jgi:hypothetical protein
MSWSQPGKADLRPLLSATRVQIPKLTVRVRASRRGKVLVDPGDSYGVASWPDARSRYIYIW